MNSSIFSEEVPMFEGRDLLSFSSEEIRLTYDRMVWLERVFYVVGGTNEMQDVSIALYQMQSLRGQEKSLTWAWDTERWGWDPEREIVHIPEAKNILLDKDLGFERNFLAFEFYLSCEPEFETPWLPLHHHAYKPARWMRELKEKKELHDRRTRQV